MYRHEQQVIKSAMPSSSANLLPSYKTSSLSSSSVSAISAGLPPNLPISLSVIKKPEKKIERKQPSDDDVIIIE